MAFKPPQKAKRDGNEKEIVNVFERFGLTVERMDKPVDLIVGFRGVNYLVEVKNGPKAPMTEDQKRFFAAWPGQVAVVSTLDEALDFAQSIRYPTKGFAN